MSNIADTFKEIANVVFEEYFKAKKKYSGRNNKHNEDEIKEDIDGLDIQDLKIESKIENFKENHIEISKDIVKKLKKES